MNRILTPRSLHVAWKLLPFLFSFVRDWRSFILFGPPRPISHKQHQARAAAIRKTMAELGPSFIKAAQVLAMREDIIMPVYARQLKRLQDQVPPFPYSGVDRILRSNFGKPVSELFDSFEEEPIAAASLGQVHRAVYRGEPVAVKVLRPGVEDLVRTDLTVVRALLGFLNMFIDENLMRSFHAITDEFERMIALEMDFRTERRNAGRFRHNFREIPRVYIPHFIDELCTRQVAVIEYIDGVRVDNREGLRQLGIDHEEIINLLIETYVRMAVIHGFIHADPHPGNLFIDDEGRLVILDHGMALSFDHSTRLELLRVVQAVVKRDVDTIVDGFYKLDMVDADINRGVMREAAQTLLDIQLTEDVTPRQVQEIAQDIIKTFYKFPLRLPNNLVYLLRASSLVEGIALHYNPRFNGIRQATPIIRRMLAEIAFDRKKPPHERLAQIAGESYITLRELVAVIHRMEREQLRVRVHEADLFEVERFLNVFLRRLLTGLGLIAVAVILAMTMLLYPSPILLILSLLVLAVLFFGVTYVPIPRGRQGGGSPFFK